MMMKANCSLLIELSTACPFRWNVKDGYQCFYCHKTIRDITLLKTHTEQHEPELIYSKVRRLGKEVLLKVDVKDIKCRLCQKAVVNLKDLQNHLSEVHKTTFYEATDGIIPYIINADDFTCGICAKNFDKFVNLNIHMNNHYKNYICDICGSGYQNQYRLLSHKKSHEQGEYACECCDKVFPNKTRRQQHEVYAHEGKLLHKCPKCPQRFKEYYQRQDHLIKIHDEKKLRSACGECGKTYNRKSHLTQHIRRDHLNERNRVCDVCSDAFFSKIELDNHMIKHTGDRIHVCSVCNKTYARRKTLMEHMKIHTNDKRYVCVECGQAFVQNCSLKGHMKTHHGDVSRQ